MEEKPKVVIIGVGNPASMAAERIMYQKGFEVISEQIRDNSEAIDTLIESIQNYADAIQLFPKHQDNFKRGPRFTKPKKRRKK